MRRKKIVPIPLPRIRSDSLFERSVLMIRAYVEAMRKSSMCVPNGSMETLSIINPKITEIHSAGRKSRRQNQNASTANTKGGGIPLGAKKNPVKSDKKKEIKRLEITKKYFIIW